MNEALIQLGIPISLMVVFGVPHGAMLGSLASHSLATRIPRRVWWVCSAVDQFADSLPRRISGDEYVALRAI